MDVLLPDEELINEYNRMVMQFNQKITSVAGESVSISNFKRYTFTEIKFGGGWV